jgi:WD40 repeat protein
MVNSPFEIKSRVNQGTPLKITPANSPLSRPGPRSQKSGAQPASLSLRKIIGTTTTSSRGLACHYDSSTFAYCAGSAAVLAKVDGGGEISYRFFRAQPTALPIHPCVSVYNPTSPTALSENRRRTILPFKHGTDDRFSNNSPRRIWGDEGSSKTWSARERVKAVSCVDLSPNGRFLAVGETGYSPRVNIFSILPGAPTDAPLSILTEHSFGVRCVAFSANSRWLATLGDVNDGFLFIWSLNPKTGAAKLHLTNKCTASVLSMAWCGNNLITVGTRHVKVWRIAEPSSSIFMKQGRSLLEGEGHASPGPRTLSGRNCLLGSLADSTFTYVAPISDSEAILCTKTGVICLLDDGSGNQELKYMRQLGCPTQSAAVDLQGQKVWFANSDGKSSSQSFEKLRMAEPKLPNFYSDTGEESMVTQCPSSPAVDPLCPFRSPRISGSRSRRKSIVASIYMPNKIVSLDNDRHIRVELLGFGIGPADSVQSSIILLPAHNDVVQGVVSLPKGSALGDYISWSPGGDVNFWSLDGSLKRSEKVELEQPEQSLGDHDEQSNELRLIRISEDAQSVVSGDRLGVLQVVECQSWQSAEVRAHSAEITDIALNSSEQSLLVATCSRDRTVQLLQYRGEEIGLLQTFDDHVGAVSAVAFVDDFLVSASSDRTVIVRQRLTKTNDDGTSLLAYMSQRVITLRASPTSMAFPSPDVLVISTMDRQILTFSITSGVVVDGFKAFDADGEDAVIFSSMSISSVEDGSGSRRILAGFSSTDKSIRLYDFDRGILLARELGHTEGISDIVLVDHAEDDSTGQNRKTIISTGLDGLIMVWDASTAPLRLPSTPIQELSQGNAIADYDLNATPIRESILRRPPLRKVLSKLDITAFVPSASPSGNQSPPRLKKKTSRYTLAPGKVNGLSASQLLVDKDKKQGGLFDECNGDRIESLPKISNKFMNKTALQPSLLPARDMPTGPETVTDDRQLKERCLAERTPSPRPAPPSLPTTPKAVNRANKGRLRRPPSIPSDLRGQSLGQSRRKSVSNVNEFGSIGMASEQVCRTLRAYRKRIKTAPGVEQLQLDEVEVELLATLRVVEERHARNGSRRTKAATENDLDNLANLMQTSGLGQWSGSLRGHVRGG